jgi:double-strand break repair protein MRE11
MENDQIRGDDSWKTFAEILNIGREYDVDMVVQGGDLFHINAPTKKSYYHVMRSLREHCWCEKPIEYKLVSDPGDAMATKHFAYPSEYDMNLNVGMPLYAISGNHDDATGEELLSPLDVLSVSGLINHFGRVIDNEQITVCPLLFNKGKTNLALYGLHSVREERLIKTMASGNLEFLEPDTGDDDGIQWFNLMCIHQNHVHRPGVKVIDETSLPTFLDFILWGHEHDCKPVAIKNDITGAYVLQAGSSIATSLNEGETLDKHVYILSVKGKDFSLKPIKLKTVRPFVMKDVVLGQTGLRATSSNKKEVLNFLMIQVELMIEKANSIWKENNIELFNDGIITDKDIPLPLIRLRVEYSGGYEVENPRFFSNRFVGKVANINDVVLFYKKRRYNNNNSNNLLLSKNEINNDVLTDEDVNDQVIEEDDENSILHMINEKLNDNDLIMLTKQKVSETLETLLEHEEDKNILNQFVKDEEEDHIDLLQQLSLNDADDRGTESDLMITSNVKDVKKSFRELAKRIKAETQYQEPVRLEESTDTRTRVASYNEPIMFNGGGITDKKDTQNKPASDRLKRTDRKTRKSKEFVVDSNSEEEQQHQSEEHEDDRLETPKSLLDIPMPNIVRGSTLNRRARARNNIRARRGARPPQDKSSQTQSNDQLSNLDLLLGKR